MTDKDLTEKIIGCAIDIHKALGPGLLESAYKECLLYELRQCELFVEKEKPLPLIYKGIKMECGYRLDLLVQNRIVVEIKAVEELDDVHLAQILTYLKLSNNKIGLLINFNVTKLTEGIRRVRNGY